MAYLIIYVYLLTINYSTMRVYCTFLHDRCIWGSELLPCQICFVEYKLIVVICSSTLFLTTRILQFIVYMICYCCVCALAAKIIHTDTTVPTLLLYQVKGKMKTKNECSNEAIDANCAVQNRIDAARQCRTGQPNGMNLKKQISTNSYSEYCEHGKICL